jgi:K+-sensing histidine kinase KdpD
MIRRQCFGRWEFIIELPKDRLAVTGDSHLFEQMLAQVFDNAWKYSRAPFPSKSRVGWANATDI